MRCPKCKRGQLRNKGNEHWHFKQCDYCGHIPEKK